MLWSTLLYHLCPTIYHLCPTLLYCAVPDYTVPSVPYCAPPYLSPLLCLPAVLYSVVLCSLHSALLCYYDVLHSVFLYLTGLYPAIQIRVRTRLYRTIPATMMGCGRRTMKIKVVQPTVQQNFTLSATLSSTTAALFLQLCYHHCCTLSSALLPPLLQLFFLLCCHHYCHCQLCCNHAALLSG